MKRILFCIIIFLSFSIFPLISDSVELEAVLNLDVSIKELNSFSTEMLDNLILSNRYIIVEGSVASKRDIERTEENFVLDIHLVNGEWIGLEKVEVYKCIVNIEGKVWETRFPKRVGRDPADNIVQLNNHILVIGKVVDYVIKDSELVSVIQAEYLRKL